jgi:hypothetical protein
MPLPRTIDRIVEDQTVRLRRPWVSPAPLAFRPVLALSQRPGARGHELARRLCDDLRYALLDREIIHEIAERAHVSDRAVAALDERERSAVRESLQALLAAQPLTGAGYLDHLIQVVRSVGRQGGAVILGRGAHLILAPGEAFRVLVDAPRHARVGYLADQEGLTRREAAQALARAEAERRAFLRQYFRAEADDLESFDLVVNTYGLGVDGAAAAIEAGLLSLAGPGS